jgi:hypothetical protein
LPNRGDAPILLPIGNNAERTEKGQQEMTRKDYELIAGVFAGIAEIIDINETVGADIAQRLADALEEENPRFNRARFLSACGVAN